MQALERWHEIVQSGDAGQLADILAEDCVFLSPVVHSPQRGRELTQVYLKAAMGVFNDSFHYSKEVVQSPHAVLEFHCEVDGIAINGVDIMTVNDAGLICEFKVMIRPLKAIEMMHAKMRAMLEQVSG